MMGIPVSYPSDSDPIAEVLSEVMNLASGAPVLADELSDIPELKEGVDSLDVKSPSENIRLAVELLLGADIDSPAYQANLEIAKGYISKEIANL